MRFKLDFNILFSVLTIPLLPIYVFPSGYPQPFHVLVILFALISILFWERSSFSLSFMLRPHFLFLVYLSIHSVIFCVVESSVRPVLAFLYWMFSAAVFLLYRKVFLHLDSRIVVYLFLLSSLLAFLGVVGEGVSFKVSDYSGRSVGFFNNPNQLGFFAVLLFVVTLVFAREVKGKKLVSFLLGVCAFTLAVLSLSKAAVISILVSLVMALHVLGARFYLVGASVVFVAFAAFDFWLILEEMSIYNRIASLGTEDDSSLASRGYFVIFDFPEKFIFGLGEEAVVSILGHEVHSIIGAVYNNFGLLGFLLFLGSFALYVNCLVRSFGLISCFIYLLPIFLYSLTHNGVRFSMLWCVLALLFSIAEKKRLQLGVV